MRGCEADHHEVSAFDHAAKRREHMQSRRDAGLTHAEVAKEFGTSKSTAHRRVSDRGDKLGSPHHDETGSEEMD